MFAASGFSLVSLWFQPEKGTLSPLECLSFANTIQADLPTCAEHMLVSLVLGLDAQRVLGEHQGITEWYKMAGKTNTKSRKNSFNFTVDMNSLKSFKRDS